MLNIKPQNLNLEMNYETALGVINSPFKSRLLSMSPEAIIDLKNSFKKVTKG